MEVNSLPFLVLALLIASPVCTEAANEEHASTYIVHMDKSAMPNEFSTHKHWYTSLLSSVKGVSGGMNIKSEDLYHYTYDTVMHGFSATLTQSQLDMLEDMPGHVSSFPDPLGTMDTTHSTEFLRLTPDKGIWPISKFGQDVIVGVLDTGIWPESRSFHDDGMDAVPARWKGACDNGTQFDPSLCNKKLIGARYFNKGLLAGGGKIDPVNDYNSARDYEGHGSHTSSTAGGNYVDQVDFYGYASGMARGVAPAARIAMYKVLWWTGGMGSDVLAGMESAINDGVDVISMSLGFDSPPYFQDSIALGAFAAIKKGVVVVCSAGNMGPRRGLMHNGAPWIFTVGASTLDRDFAASVKMGMGNSSVVFTGSSFYTDPINLKGNFNISQTALVYEHEDPACKRQLDPVTVNGSVVLCINNSSYSLGLSLRAAGALALVSVVDTDYSTLFPNSDFPTVLLKTEEAAAVLEYVSSTASPVVEIEFGMTLLSVKPAPAMAEFSSRGPYPPSLNILKPDVTAPGVKILAAWLPNSTEGNNYAIVSGTSMSCPHVAGLTVLMKAVHSDWSPAAIRSAIMTTSYTLDNSNNTITDRGYGGSPATPLDMGAGHVDPDKAVDPGLVYDLSAEDYVNFLCTLNYTTQQIQTISGSTVSCPTDLDLGSDALNYPSFTAVFDKNSTSAFSKTFKRTLTNVGDDISYYSAVVDVPIVLRVQVVPAVLEFSHKSQKLNFTLTLEAEKGADVGELVEYG
ncbi:hypothetical protein KI387_039410, partial [Taxus chinensis]